MPRVQFSRFQRPVLSLALGLIFYLPLAAQNHAFDSHGPSIHGVPPSVTSFGFGGVRGPHGIPPSVTSLGFGDVRLPFRKEPCCFDHRRHRLVSPFSAVVYYVPYVPYYPDYGNSYDVAEPGVDDTMEEGYAGGSSIFDRPGQGTRDYLRPERRPEGSQPQATTENATQGKPVAETPVPATPPQPVAEQPSTILVFRDGHELEVSNYAIIGSTLYDLNGGHTRQFALAELDLAATVKQNDQHGVDFRLPKGVNLD